MDLSAYPQQQGQMTILRVDGTGGTFDSVLPVTPRLTFTRISDGEQRVLDGGEAGMTIPFEALDVPWADHTPPEDSCTSNFCVNPDGLTIEQAALAAHGIISICPTEGTPSDSATWGTVKSIY